MVDLTPPTGQSRLALSRIRYAVSDATLKPKYNAI